MNAQAKQEVHLAGLFATPVLTTILPAADALNRDLSKAILAREKSHASESHSNLGGWQSDTGFLSWGGAGAQTLLGHVTPLVNRLTCDRQGRSVAMDWQVNAWANVNRASHGNEFHTHPGCFWSAVYYVADGGIGADASLGGELELADPRGVAPAMHAPLLAFKTAGGLAAGVSELISPRAGMLAIFPSFVSHAVRPYRGKGVRISVAVNFSATPAVTPV